MNDLLNDLNDQQKLAVTAGLGPVLVLAGAGSGKTRALTYRIAWLISEGQFKPEEILALTFTNKAAGEMQQRLQALLTEKPKNQETKKQDVSSLTTGTFHSVCARILRREIQGLRGYSQDFTIYDADDSLHVLKQIVLEMGLNEKIRPQVFGWYISQMKNRLIGVGDLDLENSFFAETLEEVYGEYQKRLRAQNALDFDDLLVKVFELWRDNPNTLKKYQERFQYVLVDEYQDTNHVQYMLLKLLAGKHRNLFVVGDDAQSIYGFRGANMQNILDFKKDYPKARVIMLEQNYRSTGRILGAANEVIKLNPVQYEKNLWTGNGEGEKVNVYEAEDERDEAEFVLSVIATPAFGRGKQSRSNEIAAAPAGPRNDEISYTPILDRFSSSIHHSSFTIPDNLSEIVILYRTHAQSRPFEELLLAAGVPYQIVGGFKFYERREIKDALAYLRLMLNPHDLVSMQRVINIPARGVGPVTLKAIVADLKKNNFNFRALQGHEKAGDFFETMAVAAALPGKKNVLELMELLLLRSGYKDYLLEEDDGEGLERWDNIQELFNAAAKYRNLTWPEGLKVFLEEVALMTDLDRAEAGANKLTLMTLHSAKGLEFDRVFLVGLEEGLLPHSRSMLRPEEIAEEIRLAYVGITRARKDLYLSYAKQRAVYGDLRRSVPSRILKAIPKKYINVLSIKK